MGWLQENRKEMLLVKPSVQSLESAFSDQPQYARRILPMTPLERDIDERSKRSLLPEKHALRNRGYF